MDRLFPKDHVPGVLHDSSTDTIPQFRVHNPFPIPNILTLRSLPNLLFRSSKLRTTTHAYIPRNFNPGKQMHESLFVVSTRMYSFSVFSLFSKRFDLIRTSKHPSASYVHVAFFLEVGKLEMSKHGKAVVIRVVVMPLVAVGVNEEDVVGQIVVVVYYVTFRGGQDDSAGNGKGLRTYVR